MSKVEEGVCSCCGISKDLTRHHVLPGEFRKILKGNPSIVEKVCDRCHKSYETWAYQKRNEIWLVNFGFEYELVQKLIAQTMMFGNWKSEARIQKYIRDMNKVCNIDLSQMTREEIASQREELTFRVKGEVIKKRHILVKSYGSDLAFINMWQNHFDEFKKIMRRFCPEVYISQTDSDSSFSVVLT